MMNVSLFRNLRRAGCAAFLCAALPALTTGAHAQTGYTITNLGTLGGSQSFANALNNSGQVVGASYTAGDAEHHAFFYDGAAMHDIDPGSVGGSAGFTFNGSTAASINNRGQIVGTYKPTAQTGFHYPASQQGFLYQNGTSTDITYPGSYLTTPAHINDAGAVVGYYTLTEGFDNQAFLWQAGTIQTLAGVSTTLASATGIDNNGQIVGLSGYSVTSSYSGFLAASGTVTTISFPTAYRVVPGAITDNGLIAGGYTQGTPLYSTTHLGVFLSTNGTITDLGTMGGENAYFGGLNASGAIVGSIYRADRTSYAFLYHNGTTTDLNTLLPANSGWLLTNATGISDNGKICGYGTYNNQYRAFLLTLNNANFAGRVALEGVKDLSKTNPAVPLGTLHLSFRTPGTTTEIAGADAALTTAAGSAFGTFTLTNAPNGTYDVAIQSSKSLRVVVPNVTITAVTVLPDVTLPAGDANGDNMVDIGDFGVLVNAYNGDVTLPGSNYDSQADFNYDGVVDIADFGLLVNEYGNAGAP